MDLTTSAEPHDDPDVRPRAAFAVLAAIQITLIAAITVIAVPLPMIQDDLDLGRMDLVLVSAGYGLSFSGLLLLGGRIADQFGRRRILVAGLTIFGLACAVAAVAPGFPELLAARFAQGSGAALAAPAAMALLGAVYPDPVRRARALASWGVLAGIGATGGLLLSGVIATWASWRWAFLPPAAVAAATALGASRLLPTGSSPGAARLDVAGAVLVTSGLTALSFGLTQLGEWGVTPAALLTLAGAAVLLAAFAVVERRVPAPLLPPALFAVAPRIVALVAALLGAAGHATVSFFVVLYLQQVRGMSPLATSAALLPFALGLVGITPLAGRLVGRAGPRAAITGGLLVGAAGLLLLSGVGVDTPYTGTLLAGLLVFPSGVALMFAGATVAALDGISDHQAGVAGGVVNTAIEAGPTVGLALLAALAAARTARLAGTGIGAAVAATGGYTFAFRAAAVLYLAAAALTAAALRLPRSRGTADPPSHA